jgi:hypothetical protein
MVKAASWLSSTREPPRLSLTRGPSWLSITPEPERELPRAVATLRCGAEPPASAVEAETARVERMVLHGGQREWLRYLHGVLELIELRTRDPHPEVQSACSRATAVISNHHNLLLGLPGRGAQMTAADRARLTHLTIDHHEVKKGPK